MEGLPGKDGTNAGFATVASGFKTSTYFDRADLRLDFAPAPTSVSGFFAVFTIEGIGKSTIGAFASFDEVWFGVSLGAVTTGANSSFGFSTPPFLFTHFFNTVS
jgi:hypothetical protein